ncbi:MAG: hypothetical protein HKN42_02190 [Granulosicoccus sp.]|nr:hypothetical protein [Granulosicoccus sp.]
MSNSHIIDSPEALSRLYRAPGTTSRLKVHGFLSEEMQRWLAHSPFFILASHGEDGLDCSPRGDEPGKAFRVLDAWTIAIPDRRGNNRLDTLHNLLVDPRVGLVFLIPGIEQALRIRGSASISVDPDLLADCALDGEPPATVILVKVVAAYVQNARAIRSAHLWTDDYRKACQDVPGASELSGTG